MPMPPWKEFCPYEIEWYLTNKKEERNKLLILQLWIVLRCCQVHELPINSIWNNNYNDSNKILIWKVTSRPKPLGPFSPKHRLIATRKIIWLTGTSSPPDDKISWTLCSGWGRINSIPSPKPTTSFISRSTHNRLIIQCQKPSTRHSM